MTCLAQKSALYAAVFFLCWTVLPVWADPPPEAVPTLEEFLQKADAAFNRRADLLRHSTGTALLKVTLSGGEELMARLAGQYRNLGLEPPKKETAGNPRGNTMKVHWYTKGESLRYDTDIRVIEGVRPWTPEALLRIATNGKVGIYYAPVDRKAYVNQPPFRAGDFVTYLQYFDPLFPYTGYSGSIFAGLRIRAKEEHLSLEYADLNGLRCIHVTAPPKVLGAKKQVLIESDLWFGVDQDYALIKQECNSRFLEDNTLSSFHSYDAKYERSAEFPEVWILKSLCQHMTEYDVQDITIDFEDVHLGVDVPDITFNYDGLGVPTGTSIYDRRSDKETPVYHYVPGVYVGLDRIDLEAGSVPPEQFTGGNCPGTDSEEKPADPVPITPPLPAAPPPEAPEASVSTMAYVLAGAFVMAVAALLAGFRFLRHK